MTHQSEWGKKWTQIVSKAWEDENFKKRLQANPAAVLKENGLEVPPGVQVRIVENTDKILHLTLPPRPSTQELADADLAAIAAGMAMSKVTASDKGKL